MNGQDTLCDQGFAKDSALGEPLLERERSGSVAIPCDEALLIADAATAWLGLRSEQDVCVSLAECLRRIVGEDVLVTIIGFEERAQHFTPRVILGTDPFLEELSTLLGQQPKDLVGGLPETVKAAMSSGRLTRIVGGVVELASEVIPRHVCCEIVRQLNLQDAFVIGFAVGRFAGGVSFVTRRPNVELRRDIIESLVRVASAVIERLRTAQAWRDSEDTCSHIFEQSAIGMSISLPTGEVTANQAFCKMLGYSPDELVGTTWREHTHPDDVEASAREVEALMSGAKQSARLEKRLLRKDGSAIWVDMTSSLRRDAAGCPLQLVTAAVDVTQRKDMEQELHRVNAFLNSVIDNIPTMLFIKDAKTLRLIRINRAVEEFLGHSRAELLGERAYAILPQKLVEFFKQKNERLLREEKVAEISEERMPISDTEERVLRTKRVPILGANGEPEYVLGICEDITEHKLAERAITEQLDELRRWHEVTLGRENRILELKREVNHLLVKLGQPARYSTGEGSGTDE